MKIAHWVTTNQSGMHHVAQASADAERRLGHDAQIVNAEQPQTWNAGHAIDADVHVIHTRFPLWQRKLIREQTGKEPRTVFVSHGIPEHTFELAVQDHLHGDLYAAQDYWAIFRHYLRTSDATVVFTPRYKDLFETMVHKHQTIDLVPMGVDKAFWAGGTPPNKLHGSPSVWMSENQHRIKWALDVFLAWPFVLRENPNAHLHAHWIPYDLHRFLIDLANTNGCSAGATISAKSFTHEQLRETWKACDFMLATTRYGDNTNLTMQAVAAGIPVISYPGNEHATYWMPEGDQRVMADTLVKIFAGEIEPRTPKPVPNIEDMGRAMVAVYERIAA